MADDPVAEALAKRQRDIVAEALARRAQPTAPANPTNSVTGARPIRGAPSFLGAHPPANADEALAAGLNQAPRPRPTPVSPAMTSPAGAVLAVGRELVRSGAQDPLDVPRQIGAGLSEVGHRFAGGLAAVGELASAGTPGLSHLAVTRPASRAIEESRDENRESYGPATTGLGVVANIGSQLAGEVALTMAGGRALQAVAPALNPSAGAGMLERFGKGMAANSLASLPVDLGQAVDPATSLTSLAAEHTDLPALDAMASSFPGRAAGEIATNALLGAGPEAFMAVRGARQARAAAQATRQAGQAQTVAEALARRQQLIDQSDQVVRERAAATEGLPIVEPTVTPPPPPRAQRPEAPAIPPELEGLPLVGEGPAGVPLINDRPIGLGETPRPRPVAPPAPPQRVYTVDDIQRALRKRQAGSKVAAAVEPAVGAPTAPEAPAAPQQPAGGAVEALRRKRLARNLPDLDPVAREEAARPVGVSGALEARNTPREERLLKLARRLNEERRGLREKVNTDPRTGLGSAHALEAATPRVDADPNQGWISADLGNVKAGNTHGPDMTPYGAEAEAIEGRWNRTTEVFRRKAVAVAQAAEELGIPARNVFTASGDEIRVAVPAGMDRDEVLAHIQRRSAELAPDTQAGGYPMSLRWGRGSTLSEADAAVEVAKKADQGPRARDLPRLNEQPVAPIERPRAPESVDPTPGRPVDADGYEGLNRQVEDMESRLTEKYGEDAVVNMDMPGKPQGIPEAEAAPLRDLYNRRWEAIQQDDAAELRRAKSGLRRGAGPLDDTQVDALVGDVAKFVRAGNRLEGSAPNASEVARFALARAMEKAAVGGQIPEEALRLLDGENVARSMHPSVEPLMQQVRSILSDIGVEASDIAPRRAIGAPTTNAPAPTKPTSAVEGIWRKKTLEEIRAAESEARYAHRKAQARGDNTELERLERRLGDLERARTFREAQGLVVKMERPKPAEGSVTPTTVRGKTVFEGGDPKFRTTSNEDLAAEWVRRWQAADDWRGRTGGKSSKRNAGLPGRAVAKANQQMNAAERIEAELRGRGLNVEYSPKPAVFDTEGRTVGTGELPEHGDASFNPEELGEAGAASHRVLAPLAGGSAGAAIGAATADPERRGEGAFKGFVGGLVAGHLSGTVFARRAPRPKVAPVDVSGMYVGRQTAIPREASKGLVGTAGRAYQDLLDHVFAAREFGRKVGGSNTLSNELERGMSWHGQADTYMGRQGQEGPTLARALKMAEGRAEDVTNLLRGERALELHDRAQGSALQLGLPEGISAKGFDIDVTRQKVKELRAIPEVAAAADAYREFYRHLLNERLANRLIDPAQYRRLVAAGEHYTPFLRDYGGDEFAQTVKSTQSEVQRGTGLRELNVDEIARAPLRDPFALAVFDAQKTARDIARQRVTNVLTDIIADHPEAARPFIEEVPAARLKEMTPGQLVRANIQEFNVDGVKRFYAVHDGDLRRALEHAAPLTQNIRMKILQAAKTVKRVGVTIVPEFGLTNAQKDLVFTANQYPVSVKKILASGLTGAAAGALLGDEDRRGMNALKGFGFGVGAGALAPHMMRTLSALGEVLGESKGVQQWLKDGGGNTGFYLKSEDDAQRLIRRLRGDNYTVGEILHPRTWWHALEQLQGAVEQAPRYARYKYLKGRGAGAAEAVAGGHNVSVNFLRHGGDPTVQGLGKVTAFWNANLQGKAKLWRDLGVGRNAEGKFRLRNPKAWALGAVAITAPTVALWMQNKDDPAYWDIPLWERNLFWHIPTGRHENGRTKFVKLAKPFELGYIFGSVPERFLDYLHQRDPRRLQQALGQMASGTFVDQMVPIPDIAQPTLDVTTTDRGYSRFTGRPIESQAMGRLPAAQRSDERTSFPAKAIGERFGVSPTKIDYWWRQTTGTLGRDVADIATAAARRAGIDDRAPTEPRGPLDRFRTRAAGFSSDPVEQLYLRNERAQQAKTAIRTAASDDEARRLFEEYRDDLENIKAMEKAVAELADARKELRAVQANRTMPLAERRKREQQIQDYVVNIARWVVDAPALQGAP